MTREDVFWILTRATMLLLVVRAVEAVAPMLGALQMDSGLTRKQATEAVGAVVAPLLAAWALFAFERRKAAPVEANQVTLALRREDLLWVALKVFGAWMLVEGVSGGIGWILYGDVFDVPLLWRTVSLLQVGLGAWFLFGDRLWRIAAGVKRDD